jgi:hypothetical protein
MSSGQDLGFTPLHAGATFTQAGVFGLAFLLVFALPTRRGHKTRPASV